MDPFVTLHYRESKFQTKTAEDQGTKPVWNETFEIPIKSADD